MLNLKQIVAQLSENDFEEFSLQLQKSKADKFHTLFSLLRKNGADEDAVMQHLEINSSAFYTLKSRLHDKLQNYFAKHVPETEIDLLKNVANIPTILFNTPRATAIAKLKKMESELVQSDMPYALTSVFNALKKIHRFSPKYFDYAQQYNKHLAYTMALDKVEELLADFCKTLGEYLLSRDKKLLELLPVIKREMNNHAQLYESHHLKVYKNILDVSFALFVPLPDEIVNDEPIDDILIQTEKIIQQYPNDTLYASLKNIVTFLWFEYYHTLKIYKKAVLYYEILNVNLSSFLLYNFCTVPSLFLISKIDTALVSDSEETLWEDFKKLSSNFTSDTADIPNHINYAKFHAVAAFYSGRNDEAIAVLNELINDISFLSFPHAEIEVKLFLALCYICANKYDLSFYLVKNVQRKLRDMKNPEYENAIVFSKLLTLQMDFSHKHRVEKMFELRNKFISLNHGEMHMLEFIRLSDDFMKQLSKTGN